MNSRSTRIHSFAPCVAACRDAVRVRHAAIAQDDFRMVVEVGIVQEAGRAHDLEPGRVGLDEKQRLFSLGDGGTT